MMMTISCSNVTTVAAALADALAVAVAVALEG